MVASFSHYELLGLQPNATAEQINAAYKQMSKSLHPDRNSFGTTLMKQVNAAKEILLDRTTRFEYDHGDLVNHQRGINSNNRHGGASSHEVRRLQTELAAAERKIATLQRSQTNLTNRVRNLERENEDMQYELSEEKRQHKALQKQLRVLKATNVRLEKENRDHTRRIDTYEGKMERISRELRDERASSAKKLADAKEMTAKKILEVKKSVCARSVCYQCDGKATSTISCQLCKGSGALQGTWTKCHNCNGLGKYATVDGMQVDCATCNSKGAREESLSTTCFKCKGKKDDRCAICYKGKIRGFNLKLCPICDGIDDNCENCLGRAFVSCGCGSDCKGHGPNQKSKVSVPSSLQRVFVIENGDVQEKETPNWKAKFFSRNWDVLSLQQGDVKGVFM